MYSKLKVCWLICSSTLEFYIKFQLRIYIIQTNKRSGNGNYIYVRGIYYTICDCLLYKQHLHAEHEIRSEWKFSTWIKRLSSLQYAARPKGLSAVVSINKLAIWCNGKSISPQFQILTLSLSPPESAMVKLWLLTSGTFRFYFSGNLSPRKIATINICLSTDI